MRVWFKVFLLVFNLVPALARADGECNTGYDFVQSGAVATLASTLFGSCPGGYASYTANYDIVYPYARELVADCGAGYYYKNGNCVAYTSGSCESGYYDETPAMASVTFDQTYAGSCLGGMDPMIGLREITYVVASASTRCGAGYYPTANGCAAHATDDCPTNYYAITPIAAFVRGDSDNQCPTNYSLYYDTDYCRKYLGTNMAKFCTPQLLCTAGPTTMRSSTGMILPLYDEKLTAPALHVGFTNGHICYVNMIPGTGTNTINANYNNQTYHGVE